jgi:hypothetical protein
MFVPSTARAVATEVPTAAAAKYKIFIEISRIVPFIIAEVAI